MNSEKRRTLPLRVKLPDLESLRDLSTELTSISRSAFIFKYGNILDLLFTNVQVEALTALAQSYDPPMRCFIFQDFQLAPTLEEFERIVGIPPKGNSPFVEIGHPPTVKKFAMLDNVKTKGNALGFFRSYLEEKAYELKATIAQLNKEKEELQASLLKATQENCELKWERVQKDKVIEGSNKRLRIEEDEGCKVRDCLGGANSQLKHKNKERDELLSIAYKLKEQWEKSQVDVKDLKEELENIRQHLNNMVNEYEGYVSNERLQREALERKLVRSQFELKKAQESLEEFRKFNDRQGEAYENLKKESEEWERRYKKLVNSVEGGTLFRILRHEGVHWKSMFSRLAKLASDVIETIPTKLVAADATMHPLNTPSEVIAFVEFCKTMIRDFREKMKKI
ncbi:hypothetical protein P8452_03758 [Trifolium repens]|nr:hypothetical protein P8452_03758 [Trifolium repens]